MIEAPRRIDRLLARSAPLRPYLSMTRPAARLAKKPPTVKTAVRRENVASDIGMQVGRPYDQAVPWVTLQVKTAWIWFKAAMW
jgi:hypothetical protein